MGFEDKKMLRQRHKRSKSCTVPEKKKLEDENSIDSSLDASQRLKLVSVLLIYDISKLI
jgi:hypothetical protein